MTHTHKHNCDKCNAPICPANSESTTSGIWYPNEEICKNRDYCDDILVKQQRKISKKTRDMNSYYTPEMLKVDCIVKGGMAGIDPDKEYIPQFEMWRRKHPPISEKRRSTSKLWGSKVGTHNLSNNHT